MALKVGLFAGFKSHVEIYEGQTKSYKNKPSDFSACTASYLQASKICTLEGEAVTPAQLGVEVLVASAFPRGYLTVGEQFLNILHLSKTKYIYFVGMSLFL
jgi:hypothetical protein